jgi:DNA gyrase subunit A
MAFVRGPDFPTGGFIYGREGIRDAYETGRGRVVMRARAGDRGARGGPKGERSSSPRSLHGQQVARHRADRRAGARQEARGSRTCATSRTATASAS